MEKTPTFYFTLLGKMKAGTQILRAGTRGPEAKIEERRNAERERLQERKPTLIILPLQSQSRIKINKKITAA